MMSISIREATIDDAAALTAVGVETFVETWALLTDPDDLKAYLDIAYSADSILSDLKNPDITYFIAEDEGRVIGFSKLSRRQELAEWITDRCLEICRLYVYKEYHDHKVGKLLMEASIELAEKENMESVVLGVWENNLRAVAFYKKWDFKMVGTHPFVLGKKVDMDWVMMKKL